MSTESDEFMAAWDALLPKLEDEEKPRVWWAPRSPNPKRDDEFTVRTTVCEKCFTERSATGACDC
jgi:hypothetical protein